MGVKECIRCHREYDDDGGHRRELRLGENRVSLRVFLCKQCDLGEQYVSRHIFDVECDGCGDRAVHGHQLPMPEQFKEWGSGLPGKLGLGRCVKCYIALKLDGPETGTAREVACEGKRLLEHAILLLLGETPAGLMVGEITKALQLGHKTAGQGYTYGPLYDLRDDGYVVQPSGPHTGYVLTDAGRRRLASANRVRQRTQRSNRAAAGGVLDSS